MFAPISPELPHLALHMGTSPHTYTANRLPTAISQPLLELFWGDGPCTPVPLVPVLLRTPLGECTAYNNHLLANLGLVISTTLEFLSHSSEGHQVTQDLRYSRCLVNIYGYKQITYRHHGSTNPQMLLSWGRAWGDMEIWGVSKERIILDSLSLISFCCGKIQIPQQK